jgi:hypothetical protein
MNIIQTLKHYITNETLIRNSSIQIKIGEKKYKKISFLR